MKLSEASPGTQATFDWEETHVPVVRRLGWREGRVENAWVAAVIDTMTRPYVVTWAEKWASQERVAKRKANLRTRLRNRARRLQEEAIVQEREKVGEDFRHWRDWQEEMRQYREEAAKAIEDFEKWKASYEVNGKTADALVSDLKRVLKHNPGSWDQLANRGDIDARGRYMLDKAYERIMEEDAD